MEYGTGKLAKNKVCEKGDCGQNMLDWNTLRLKIEYEGKCLGFELMANADDAPKRRTFEGASLYKL